MSKELKPCPFCGGEDTEIAPGLKGDWYIGCLTCNYQIRCEDCTEEDTVRYWNTRPAEDALKAENERLKEALIQIGISMLYSDDENADNIFRLCKKYVADDLNKAYVDMLADEIEELDNNPDTEKGEEDE